MGWLSFLFVCLSVCCWKPPHINTKVTLILLCDTNRCCIWLGCKSWNNMKWIDNMTVCIYCCQCNSIWEIHYFKLPPPPLPPLSTAPKTQKQKHNEMSQNLWHNFSASNGAISCLFQSTLSVVEWRQQNITDFGRRLGCHDNLPIT